jgi:hypothetical protein
MSSARTFRRRHHIIWAIVAALGGSLLGGVVCGGEPEDEQAMECCRKDGAHCNMPEKKNDCCKPNRTGKNPAAVEIAGGNPTKQRIENGLTAQLPSVVAILYKPDSATPIPLARGFPEPLARKPRVLPLLI